MNETNLFETCEKISKGMEIIMGDLDISVGTTPSEVIYTEDKMKLIHFIPTVKKTSKSASPHYIRTCEPLLHSGSPI